MGLKQVSFVERSSLSQRVPYQRFLHCIGLTFFWMNINLSLPLSVPPSLPKAPYLEMKSITSPRESKEWGQTPNSLEYKKLSITSHKVLQGKISFVFLWTASKFLKIGFFFVCIHDLLYEDDI